MDSAHPGGVPIRNLAVELPVYDFSTQDTKGAYITFHGIYQRLAYGLRDDT
jgi:hypothetical protein